MLEIYTYEYIKATNDERRARALDRYERLLRRPDETASQRPANEAEVVEIAFADGCPSADQLTA